MLATIRFVLLSTILSGFPLIKETHNNSKGQAVDEQYTSTSPYPRLRNMAEDRLEKKKKKKSWQIGR